MSEPSKLLSMQNVEGRFFVYKILLFLETIFEICFLEMSITECNIQLSEPCKTFRR